MDHVPLLSVLVVTSRPEHRLALRDQLRAIRWPRKELLLLEHVPRGTQDVPLEVVTEDPTWEQVVQLTATDPPVGDTLKVADLRNLILMLAAGDFLTWVDDDDWRHPEHAANLIREMEEDEELADGAGPGIGLWTDLTGIHVHQYKLPQCPVFGASVFRCTVLGRAKFPEGMAKGSDTIWVQKLRKAERGGSPLRIGTTKNRMALQTFVAVSHGRNLSNPEPYGEWVPALTAATLDACNGFAYPNLQEHLNRLRKGREKPVMEVMTL